MLSYLDYLSIWITKITIRRLKETMRKDEDNGKIMNKTKITSEQRRERVRCMERVTWKQTWPYGKQTANGNLLYDSGNANRDSVTIYKGGMGRECPEGGACVSLWLLLVDVWQKTAKLSKAIILQLKNIVAKTPTKRQTKKKKRVRKYNIRGMESR